MSLFPSPILAGKLQHLLQKRYRVIHQDSSCIYSLNPVGPTHVDVSLNRPVTIPLSPPAADSAYGSPSPSPSPRSRTRRALLALVGSKKRIRRPSFVDRLYPQPPPRAAAAFFRAKMQTFPIQPNIDTMLQWAHMQWTYRYL